MVQPLLTIAVPSYNVEKYLEHGLTTYCDKRLEGLLEVVVVNDGSTDATRAIAEEFVRKNPKIFKLLNKENGGHGSAVNAGARAASGKYFRVIDGDDWADTENLVRLMGFLEHAETDLVVDVKCEVNMLTGMREVFPLPVSLPREAPTDFSAVCANGTAEPYIMIHTLMIKTDYLKSIDLRLLEHAFYVDYEYVVKATLDAKDILFLDVNVCQYLVGNAAQSVADGNYVKRWDDHTRVTETLLDLYEGKKSQLSPERLAYLKHRCALICNTHYNIALIFDADRKRGARRGRDFRTYLHAKHPDIAAQTDKRYRIARMLHYLGVRSQAELSRLRRL